MPHPNPLPKGEGARRAGEAVLILCLFALAMPACRWRPSFPANRIAASLRHMCSADYKLSVEARHKERALQALVWKVGLFKGPTYELQSVSKEALEAMDHVLLCATRIVLSTDAPLDFIEVKLADVLTGANVTLWRYVPDIRDSMYQRIGDTEYFNRLVIEIEPGKKVSTYRRISEKTLQEGTEVQWDRPVTMTEFLAKQVILRLRRDGAEAVDAHADLSNPTDLGVVIDNWASIQEEGPDRADKVQDLIHKLAQKVVQGYHFSGFRSLTLRDAKGVALSRWAF